MITYGQLFDAIEKNGYEQAIRVLCDFDTLEDGVERVTKACAMGQGLLNLGIKPHNVDSYVGEIVDGDNFRTPEGRRFNAVYQHIFGLNDDNKFKPRTIARNARKLFANILDESLPNIDKYIPQENAQ